jgi:hypothetical protein
VLTRIGIDLDNTIISYDQAFAVAAERQGLVAPDNDLNKDKVRSLVRALPDGERSWQQLQGHVYGKGIGLATLFRGVERFLWRCHNRSIDVEIVSHKTRFGHHDLEQISLRDAADRFLAERGVVGVDSAPISSVSYFDSRDDKITYISEGKFDWFIDDLPEVVCDHRLNTSPMVLFGANSSSEKLNDQSFTAISWDEVEQKVLGAWKESEAFALATKLLTPLSIESVTRLPGRGNSQIYQVVLPDGQRLAMKLYPQKGAHNRLLAEYGATTLFKQLDLKSVQRPFTMDSQLGVGIYEWIDGEQMTQFGSKEILASLELIRAINQPVVRPTFKDFGFACDACISGKDVQSQLMRRLKQFDSAREQNDNLDKFFSLRFLPLVEQVISWTRELMGDQFFVDVKDQQLALSPSDFGMHNTLKVSEDKIVFHDFEYFGFDDPVKLICDFVHHASMKLTSEQEQQWVAGAVDIFGKEVKERIYAFWPLYGLIWCLIILNEFRDEMWCHRCLASHHQQDDRESVLKVQLEKASLQLEKVAAYYCDPYYLQGIK